ncbi:hypothetical protein MHYP_G00277780 [Metynnis hypsauchen]
MAVEGRYANWPLILVLCGLLPLDTQAGRQMPKLSDKKLCADAECSHPILIARALQDYYPQDCRFIPIRQGQLVYVYAMLKDQGNLFWAGSVQGSYYSEQEARLGHFPSSVVEETHALMPAEVVVPTDSEVWRDFTDEAKFRQYGWRCSTNEDAYSTATLIGNWAEKRVDTGRARELRRPLPSQASIAASVKREPRSFPGHQPELDPPHTKSVPNSCYRLDFSRHGLNSSSAAPTSEVLLKEDGAYKAGLSSRVIGMGRSGASEVLRGAVTIRMLSEESEEVMLAGSTPCWSKIRLGKKDGQKERRNQGCWMAMSILFRDLRLALSTSRKTCMADRTIPHAYPMSVNYEMCTPARIYDQNFAEALSPQDLMAPVLYHGYYIRPRINKQLERGFSQVDSDDDWYRVQLDVCQFTPDELNVRTVDNLLEVTGRHAQRMDQHGFVSREFARTYILPMGVDPLLLQVSLSHDGILCIQAPRKVQDLEPKINQLKIRVDKKGGKSS